MIRAFLALALLTLLAFASPPETATQANSRVAIHDTGWLDVEGDNVLRQVGTLTLKRPGVVIASLEFRYAYEAENLFGPAVNGYQVGYGFEYHVGDEGRQVCSNSCGGDLAAGDGSDWQPPQPWPSVLTGFHPGSDHHYIPNDMAFAVNLGVFQAGEHAIDFAAYGPTPQQWGDSLNPTYPSHSWEVNSCYMQMRVRIAVAESGS